MRKETLRHTVADYLMEANLGEAEFTRCYHLGVRALKELAFDVNGEVRTEKLIINPDGTAELPENCLKVTKIGILRHGEIRAFTRNSNISKAIQSARRCCERDTCQRDPNCPCRISNERGKGGIGYGTSPFYPPGGSLGIGSWTTLGEYRIDGNLIYFGSSVIGCGEDIYVEYNTFTDEDGLGDMYLHPYTREAVIAYIRWRYAINRKNQDKWDKQYFEKEWHREKRNAKYRMKSHSLQELNQGARQHTKGGLKH